jgi:hypothetical protein
MGAFEAEFCACRNAKFPKKHKLVYKRKILIVFMLPEFYSESRIEGVGALSFRLFIKRQETEDYFEKLIFSAKFRINAKMMPVFPSKQEYSTKSFACSIRAL